MRETESDRLLCVFFSVCLSLSHKYRWHSLRLQEVNIAAALRSFPVLTAYITNLSKAFPKHYIKESFEEFTSYFKPVLVRNSDTPLILS